MDIRMKLGVLALALSVIAPSAGAQSSGAAMVEEEVNPAEVVMRNGQPWYYGRNGYERLDSRRQGGETVYFHKVPAYDPETGHAPSDDRAPEPARVARPSASPAPVFGQRGGEPLKYYGNGLYGPDHFRSQYNRDARQIHSGPGYYESCSRYDGCRGVRVLPYGRGPYAPVVVPVPVPASSDD